MTGTELTAEPTWRLILHVAEQLTEDGEVPFRRRDLVNGVRLIDPNRRETSIHPIIQGMTEGATGAPPVRCGQVLRRVARGQYVLVTDEETEFSKETAEPAPSVSDTGGAVSSVSRRLQGLEQYFDTYVQWYDSAVPFVRAGQYELHRRTIDRRYELGSSRAAVEDQEFLESLYATLQAWGIGRRASRLVSPARFRDALAAIAGDVDALDGVGVEDPAVDPQAMSDRVFGLIGDLGVVDNKALVVAGTKTLHHLLPDLVIPMDRQWTGLFFRWSTSSLQYDQERTFTDAYAALIGVAQGVRPSRLVGAGWRTSSAKIVDNAVIGYCRAHELS